MSGNIITTHSLGFARIGVKRELKKALEAYWNGQSSAETLQQTAEQLRTRHWQLQQQSGIDLLPVGDSALTSWYMAKLSAMIWSSILPSTCKATCLLNKAGCKVTAAAALNRRSSTAILCALAISLLPEANTHNPSVTNR